MKIGIVGLPNAGKTTIFNALTHSHAPSENYPFCTIQANAGAVEVPDSRLDRLAELLRPERTIPARVEFLDVAGLVEGASRGEGLGNQFLAAIRQCRAIAQVVRCFRDERVSHPLGDVQPRKELDIVAVELLLADLQVAEKALRRKARERGRDDILARFREALSKGTALRRLDLSSEETALVKEFQFLSLKPLIVVANRGEDRRDLTLEWVEEARRTAREMGAGFVAVCGKLEEELAEIPDEEAELFVSELGLTGRPLARFVERCHELLGLITFFTAEGGILQAWSVPAGTRAPEAAGRVHSDMQRGFVKAEVVDFDALEAAGSFSAARERGLLRPEGKEYIVGDGDVIRFRFT